MPRSKRKEREIRRIKQDILDAAAKVFARGGYDGATMHEIAREAGYSAPSLYAYFEGKEAILLALSQGFLQEVLEVFDEPLPHGLSLEQSLELLMQRLLELCDRRRAALIVFFNFMTLREPLPQRPEDRGTNPSDESSKVIARAARWLEENAPPDDLGGHSPEDGAVFLFGIVYGFFIHWLNTGTRGQLTDLLPLTLDLFLRGIRGSQNPRSPLATTHSPSNR